MNKKILWGFIGCGNVVENKTGHAFNDDNSKVQAVMRRDINKAKGSAAMFDANFWYDNIDDLLNDKNINAVYIATPPGLHLEQATKCCEKQLSTFIEKPLGRNYAESLQIVEMYKSAGVPLFVDHFRRSLSKFITIKEILGSGKIGEVLEVSFRLNKIAMKEDENDLNDWRNNVELSGGGKFIAIATHAIDMMVFLFGNFTKVFGIASNNSKNYALEDIITMCFETDKGVLGTANFNFVANDKEDKMIIYGSKGKMEFNINGDKVKVIIEDREKEYDFDKSLLKPDVMIKEIINELITKTKQNTCSGEESLETYRIMDEVLDSFYKGRQNDFWERTK
jgi:predicted dehydrogenase